MGSKDGQKRNKSFEPSLVNKAVDLQEKFYKIEKNHLLGYNSQPLSISFFTVRLQNSKLSPQFSQIHNFYSIHNAKDQCPITSERMFRSPHS